MICIYNLSTTDQRGVSSICNLTNACHPTDKISILQRTPWECDWHLEALEGALQIEVRTIFRLYAHQPDSLPIDQTACPSIRQHAHQSDSMSIIRQHARQSDSTPVNQTACPSVK